MIQTGARIGECDEEPDILVPDDGGDDVGSKQVDDDKTNSCLRRNPRLRLWAATFLLSLAVVLPLEILDVVYRDESPWVRLFGADDVGGADWCEALDADLTQFIIEPWNSRSDYAFVAWGCFLMVLGTSDFRRLPSSSAEQRRGLRDDEENAGAASAPTSAAASPPREQNKSLPNPLLRYPHITVANGIFNLLHGLGSFWNHACECGYGGRADVSGMLSVIVFPLAYTPVHLLAVPPSPSGRSRRLDLFLSALPPIGQALFFVLVWCRIVPAIQTFTILVCCTIGVLPLSFTYLYCWRNKGKGKTRRRHRQQRHRLRLWLFPLGLVCFGAAYWAWQLDVKGIWCFQQGILMVLQGHAVWHLLSAVALICVYWIYRSEQVFLVKAVTDSMEDPEVNDGERQDAINAAVIIA